MALAMQEPQYRSPGVRELLDAVAKAKVPCMSIMNFRPMPYLKRIPHLATDPLKPSFTDASVWDNFDPGLVTLCSPDPQAIRPPGEKINVLQVTLPTNFKVARFAAEAPTAILRQMQADIEAVRYDPGDGAIDLRSSSKFTTRSSCRWPNGPCCSPAITAILDRIAPSTSRTPSTPTSPPRVRSTIGSLACARSSGRLQTIWCRSRNTKLLQFI